MIGLVGLVCFWVGLWLGHWLTDPVCNAPCCDPRAEENKP